MQRLFMSHFLKTTPFHSPISTTNSSGSAALCRNAFSPFVFAKPNHHHHRLHFPSWKWSGVELERKFVSVSVSWFRGCCSSGRIEGLGVLFRGGLPSPYNFVKYNSNNGRGGWRSWHQKVTTDGVVLGLIAANVAVFLMWRAADRDFMNKNFTISVHNFTSGRIHTLITSAFSHVDAGHLMSNMIGLYFFGTSTGRIFGPVMLLKLYFSGALAGSVFYLVHHAFLARFLKGGRMWDMDLSRVPARGASGAVNAIMLLNIFTSPRATLYLNFIIPVPAILLGMFLIGSDILRVIEGDPQISGSAHLGGATVAALAWLRLGRPRF